MRVPFDLFERQPQELHCPNETRQETYDRRCAVTAFVAVATLTSKRTPWLELELALDLDSWRSTAPQQDRPQLLTEHPLTGQPLNLQLPNHADSMSG